MPTDQNIYFLSSLEAAQAAVKFPPEEQEVLDRVNSKIAEAPFFGEMMDFLFETIQEIYPCDRVGLAFVEDDGRRLTAQWCRALYQPVLLKNGYSEDLSGSSLRHIFESGCSRVIHDLVRYEEENPRSASTRQLVREGVRSNLTCPIFVQDRPFGVLFLSSREPHSYVPYHAQLWFAIAERISQSVEKAWRLEQLLAANQAYTEMLGFVSHELKNPVASMITDARVLKDGYLGPIDPKHAEKLNKLIKKGEYLLDLVREYLDLARMEGGKLRLNPVTVDLVEEVLEPAIELIYPQVQEKQQTFTRNYTAQRLPVTLDPSLVKIVVVNLLGNASKYGRAGGAIRMDFQQWVNGFLIKVWNEGPGFQPEERTRLFRKFSRLQTPEHKNTKGTGVGLYTAWRIIRLHGGRMDANSEYGNWAEFSLEIPQPLPLSTQE